MAVRLFGFKIGRDSDKGSLPSFTPPEQTEGAVVVEGSGWNAGGAYGQQIDLAGAAKTEIDLINQYRNMSLYPECEYAIDDITNEAIICEENKSSVAVVLDNLRQPVSIKKKIQEEFDNVMRMLDFNNRGYDIFRRWYVDGRLYYHMVIDVKNPRSGIQELRPIDARKIRLVKEVQRNNQANAEGQSSPLVQKTVEYFLYNPNGMMNAGSPSQGLKVSKDSISYTTSGLLDTNKTMVIGHLHSSIKPLNQLRMIEDALVIYRLSRAPERRIFYVDVGNLPKVKAEQYLKDIMTRFKNKLIYDSSTGTITDDRHHRTMLEDYWLPRREGGRGTEVTTLPGGQNLGEIEDIEYFQKKLYKSLKIPISRLQPDDGFSLGRSTEISRDEVKFSKFITRLRQRFSMLFAEILQTQLRLKGIITEDDWIEMKDEIHFDFLKNVHFAELQEADVMRNRLEMLREIDEYNGKYYSTEWIRKNILMQTDDDIETIDRQIKEQEPEETEEQ